MGALAAGLFDRIIFREDPDRRGRAPGEVPRLLRDGAMAADCPETRVEMVPDETQAVDHCLRHSRPGDLVVIAADTIDAVWQQITGFTPEMRQDPLQAGAAE